LHCDDILSGNAVASFEYYDILSGNAVASFDFWVLKTETLTSEPRRVVYNSKQKHWNVKIEMQYYSGEMEEIWK
jgi:hypothetical protein